MNCTCGHRLRTIKDLDSGQCVRCRMKAALADRARYDWQCATIVKPGQRCVFDDHGSYEQNYLDAHEHMLFFADIARRDGWRIVRGK